MSLRNLTQLFSFRDIRNAVLGFSVVIVGLSLAGVTLYAHRTGDPQLAGFAAGASLVFVLLIFVFVIPPLARSASLEASQMNLPFEFTVGGAVILGLIAIVGFAAWNTGNNLLFLVLSLLASSLVVGFVVGNFCLKKLDVKMRFPETIFAEEATPILVSLHNRKRIFPTFSVVAKVRGKDRENSVLFDEVKKILPVKWAEKLTRPPLVEHVLDYFVHVPRNDLTENTAEHVFHRRGRFTIKDFELSTKFPFGFFRHRRRLSAQSAEIVIFPKIVRIEEETIDLPHNAGKFAAQKKGLGQDLLALRDYQPMDDLRRVDWKATARTRRLIVREFYAEDQRRVTVVFDSRFSNITPEKPVSLRDKIEAEQKGKILSPVSERFETGITQAASLLAHFAEEQAEIRLLTNDEVGEFGSGKAHLGENLKRLALIEPNYDAAAKLSSEMIEEILSQRDNSRAFLITTESEQNLPDAIAQSVKLIKF